MTWSIIARDPDSGHLGIAVASRFFAVGSAVPHIRGRIGAIATQAFVSPIYGTDGLKMLADGMDPEGIVKALTSPDDGRELRQMHIMDANGRSAAFTGSRCIHWAGHVIDDNVSVAGNMLVGPAVIEDTLQAYKHAAGQPMAERLMAAMEAGEAAGGDLRGRQSAALVIYRDQDYAWLNIRADDHPDPLAELRRLYAVAGERYLHVADTMPTRENPHGVTERAGIDAKIAALEAARIAEGRPSPSFATPLKPS